MSDSKRVNHNAGFGLVGVLIALGLLGTLIAGTMAAIQQVLAVQGRQKFRDGVDSFAAEVRSNLADQTACRSSFQGTLLTATTNAPFNAIKNAGNVNFVTLNAAAADNATRVTDIRLDTYDAAAGTVLLKLTFQAQASSVMGGSTVVRTIRLQTRKDGTNALTDCVAMAKMSDGIWQIKPGTDDIFFIGGRVGAQTHAPVTTLDVIGEVKFGNTNIPCTPVIEGAQRYNNGTKEMEFCDGVSWKKLAQTVPPAPSPTPTPMPATGAWRAVMSYPGGGGVRVPYPNCCGAVYCSGPSGPCAPYTSKCYTGGGHASLVLYECL